MNTVSRSALIMSAVSRSASNNVNCLCIVYACGVLLCEIANVMSYMVSMLSDASAMRLI